MKTSDTTMKSSRSVIRKFLCLQPREQLILIEALFALALGFGAVALLPFRYIRHLAELPIRKAPPPPNQQTLTVRKIRWAVLATARRVPWRALCFEQGLATQFMLRRRGIVSELYFGAAPDDQEGLIAHVWLRVGSDDIIGGENASRFAVLAKLQPRVAVDRPNEM